jgi:hypothetical protein
MDLKAMTNQLPMLSGRLNLLGSAEVMEVTAWQESAQDAVAIQFKFGIPEAGAPDWTNAPRYEVTLRADGSGQWSGCATPIGLTVAAMYLSVSADGWLPVCAFDGTRHLFLRGRWEDAQSRFCLPFVGMLQESPSPITPEHPSSVPEAWLHSRMTSLYYSGDEADTDYPCEVHITDKEITVNYFADHAQRIQYRGENHGTGHFELRSNKNAGKASLHRTPGSQVIEGSWAENSVRGMWRIWLA